MKRGGSLSFLVRAISNVLVMEIGWTDVGSGGYILVSTAILVLSEGSIVYSWVRVKFMVFNATFNNISVISWQSVLLVEETGVRRENHRPVASH